METNRADDLLKKDTWTDVGDVAELPSEEELHAAVDSLEETEGSAETPLSDVPLETLLKIVDEKIAEEKEKPVNPFLERKLKAERHAQIAKDISETLLGEDIQALTTVLETLPEDEQEADLAKIAEHSQEVADAVRNRLAQKKAKAA